MLVLALSRFFESTYGSDVDWKSVRNALESKRDPPLFGRGNCGTNPSWQTTISAWFAANTDSNLASWWSNVTDRPHQSFVNELAKGFGRHDTGFLCGINDFSTCIAPGCSGTSYGFVLSTMLGLTEKKDYQDDSDPVWAFFALISVVNINTFFNDMFVGVYSSKYHFRR